MKRTSGILLLLLMFLDPVVTGKVARKGANDFVVLVDDGQSMGLHAGEEFRAALKRAAESAGSWMTRLEEQFRVDSFRFSNRMRKLREPGDLGFEGHRTDLVQALEQVQRRYARRPLAGILVFSDGGATDFSRFEELALDVPVYPVLCEAGKPLQDVGIHGITVRASDFEDAPVTLTVEARSTNLDGTKLELSVTEEDGSKLAGETHRIAGDREDHPFRVRFRPLRTGVSAYRVTLAIPKPEREATLLNNERLVSIDRGRGPYRILYVTGRPNWDYKFLRRALAPDPELELVGLIRVAKREPKFEWRGRRGESSNPLFRGFQEQLPEEETAHDQPVLIRLNTRDAEELRTDFPREREELFGNYHAVVVDDLEAGFFTEDQQRLVEKFVSVRGGSLLMLGGQESLDLGGYDRTTLGQMLPVYLDGARGAPPPEQARFRLTREGWLEPWARLRRTEAEEEVRLAHMPAFRAVHQLGAVKPGASIVAMAVDEERGGFPALVVHSYGEGRVAALPIGDLWRWGMEDEALREDMNRSWRQLVRWLVADVPRFVEVDTRWEDPRLAKRKVAIRVRKEDYLPEENATVELLLRESGAEGEDPVRQFAEPSLEEPGLYEAELSTPEPGAYRLEVLVNGEDGERLGSGEAGWSWNPAADEFASLQAQPGRLEQVAEATGGEMLRREGLASFVRELPQREAPLQEVWVRPLWHQAWVFLLILVLFASEWGLRRWKGLA